MATTVTSSQDTKLTESEIVENAIRQAVQFYASPQDYETITLFDREKGQFLALDEGWKGFERVHRVWLHIERRGDKWWIQQDQTYDGIATVLVEAGIPQNRIVLAFQHPSRRPYGSFAAF
jgi:hypothetical protein